MKTSHHNCSYHPLWVGLSRTLFLGLYVDQSGDPIYAYCIYIRTDVETDVPLTVLKVSCSLRVPP